MSSTAADPSRPSPAAERRANPRVRSVFAQAHALIAPFFAPGADWGGHTLDHLAYRALREHFPGLTEAEVQQIVTAAAHVRASGRTPVAHTEHTEHA